MTRSFGHIFRPVLSYWQARAIITMIGQSALERWLNSQTQGVQQPAAYRRPSVAIPLPWLRAASAVTHEFI